jgi:preprotein translocase subunit SecE
MDNTRKILAISFVTIAIIAGYISAVAYINIAAYFQLMERYQWAVPLQNVIPILIGLVTLFVCYKVTKIREYSLEVINEVKKVIWPGRKETSSATVVVIVAVIISGLVLGLFDWLAGAFLRLILQ